MGICMYPADRVVGNVVYLFKWAFNFAASRNPEDVS